MIDIDTAMGDNTQLGHASSLQSGQRVPDGKRYHGSPAVETTSDYCPIESIECGALRTAFYSSFELAALFLVAVPVPVLAYHLWEQYSAAAGVSAGLGISMLSLLGVSAAGFFGALIFALAAVYVIPRLCMMFLQVGVTYPTFGFHHLLQSVIRRVSNSQFFCVLFGNSSFITTYMRHVGWNLNKVEQTGSNMGTNQRHDNPFLCSIGSGTMVSDGLSMINTHMSATSFQLAESKIGDNNYLGNDIFYPPNGRTGANVLLGTKAMIPIDGPVRENVGLLGSPAFEIPRMVDRDRDMNASVSEETRRVRLRQKNKYNFVTAVLFLMSRWMSVFAALVLWTAALAGYDRFGVFALLAATAAIAAAYLVFFVVIERASLHFARLGPKIASIYDPYFWFHERHWKLSESPITGLFSGTPFRVLLLRALGMKVGAKVFDCSRSITERTLTRSRRLRQSQRGLRAAGALARGGRVQVRSHPPRQRMLGRPRRLRALRRHHGRPRRARCRLLPDEGRSARCAHRLARQSGEARAPSYRFRRRRHAERNGDARLHGDRRGVIPVVAARKPCAMTSNSGT